MTQHSWTKAIVFGIGASAVGAFALYLPHGISPQQSPAPASPIVELSEEQPTVVNIPESTSQKPVPLDGTPLFDLTVEPSSVSTTAGKESIQYTVTFTSHFTAGEEFVLREDEESGETQEDSEGSTDLESEEETAPKYEEEEEHPHYIEIDEDAAFKFGYYFASDRGEKIGDETESEIFELNTNDVESFTINTPPSLTNNGYYVLQVVAAASSGTNLGGRGRYRNGTDYRNGTVLIAESHMRVRDGKVTPISANQYYQESRANEGVALASTTQSSSGGTHKWPPDPRTPPATHSQPKSFQRTVR